MRIFAFSALCLTLVGTLAAASPLERQRRFTAPEVDLLMQSIPECNMNERASLW
jgi:hypothetical protein